MGLAERNVVLGLQPASLCMDWAVVFAAPRVFDA